MTTGKMKMLTGFLGRLINLDWSTAIVHLLGSLKSQYRAAGDEPISCSASIHGLLQ